MLPNFRKKRMKNKRENKDKAPFKGVGGLCGFQSFFVRVHKCVHKFAIVLKKNYLCVIN